MSRYRISVAPMVDVTDGSYRVLARMLSSNVHLFTEMYVARAVVRNPKIFMNTPYVDKVTCQIAGDQPQMLKQAIDIAHSTSLFESFNLNLGCPATSASSGLHGAILLKDRKKLIELLAPVSEHCKHRSIDLSVKLRTGVDEFTSYDWFVSLLRDMYKTASIDHFIVHARPACLDLNTQQNREIPELNYHFVTRALNDLTSEFGPNKIRVELNGGIRSATQLHDLIRQMPALSGTMSGRWFDKNMMDLQFVDSLIYSLNHSTGVPACAPKVDPVELIENYCSKYLAKFPSSTKVGYVRPLLNVFHGEKGSRIFRTELQNGRQQGLTAEASVRRALKVRQDYLVQSNGCE